MTDTPNFKTWDKDELANWANHAYLTIQTNQAEMEQLRLKIASIVEELQGVRNLIASVVDPLWQKHGAFILAPVLQAFKRFAANHTIFQEFVRSALHIPAINLLTERWPL